MNAIYREELAIKNLLDEYFAAVYRADIDKLKTIFHPTAGMYGYLGENVVAGTPQIFYDDLASKKSMAEDKIDCKCVIESIAVCGGIATAQILVDGFFGFATVRDCFHLLKEGDYWHIVCKTFTTL